MGCHRSKPIAILDCPQLTSGVGQAVEPSTKDVVVIVELTGECQIIRSAISLPVRVGVKYVTWIACHSCRRVDKIRFVDCSLVCRGDRRESSLGIGRLEQATAG